MVFAAYFITWLHAFPNSLNYLIIGPTPNTTEYTKELEEFGLFKNNVPSYGVTQLVSDFLRFSGLSGTSLKLCL
jgi:hypothetical protein